jgi:uncharacterized lipoprotein YmbA
MNRHFSVAGKVLAGLLLTWLLSGCLSNTVKPKSFYLLNPDYSLAVVLSAEQAQQLPEPLSVQIMALHLPPYLDRKQIVTRSSQNELDVSDDHRWGGKLGKNLSRILAKNLSHYLSTPAVTVLPKSTRIKPGFQLEVEIIAFERDSNNRVMLSAQWRLLDKDKQQLATGIEDLEGEVLANGNDYHAIVSSMSSVFARLSHQLAKIIASYAL